MRVFPCLPLIPPSLLRWRLSRPALLMLLSIVPATESIFPTGPSRFFTANQERQLLFQSERVDRAMMLVAKLGLQLVLMPFRGLAVPYRLPNFKPLELRVPEIERLVNACPAMRSAESVRFG